MYQMGQFQMKKVTNTRESRNVELYRLNSLGNLLAIRGGPTILVMYDCSDSYSS